MTMIVKSSATRVTGADPRDESLVIPLFALHAIRMKRVMMPGEEGDARGR